MKTTWALLLFLSNKFHNHRYLLGGGDAKTEQKNEQTKEVFELKSEPIHKVY